MILPVPHQVQKNKYRSFLDCVIDNRMRCGKYPFAKFNPFHDKLGRFARADGGICGGNSVDENSFLEKGKEIETEIRETIIPKMNTDQLFRQAPHIRGTKEFNEREALLARKNEFGPSFVTLSEEEILTLVNQYKGTGLLKVNRKGIWDGTELITRNDEVVGNVVNNLSGKTVPTPVFKIHYDYDSNRGKISKNRGVHIVPDYPSKKKR